MANKPSKLPPLDLIEAKFEYDPVQGVLIYKKSGKVLSVWDRTSNAPKVRVGRLTVGVQRVAWYLFYREDPGINHKVMHINGDPFDNRIGNLRLQRC